MKIGKIVLKILTACARSKRASVKFFFIAYLHNVLFTQHLLLSFALVQYSITLSFSILAIVVYEIFPLFFHLVLGDTNSLFLFLYTKDLDNPDSEGATTPGGTRRGHEKAVLARLWGNFDSRYMKPLLTHSRPTLLETLPVCLSPLARLLTTTEQLTQDGPTRRPDSDSDLCIDDDDRISRGGPTEGASVRRNSINRLEIMDDSNVHATFHASTANIANRIIQQGRRASGKIFHF